MTKILVYRMKYDVRISDKDILLIAGSFFDEHEKSRYIRSNKIFTVTKSYNTRTFFSCTDNSVQIILAENSKVVRAFEFMKNSNYSLEDIFILLIFLINKMNNNFGICLRFKYYTLILQICF